MASVTSNYYPILTSLHFINFKRSQTIQIALKQQFIAVIINLLFLVTLSKSFDFFFLMKDVADILFASTAKFWAFYE